LVYRRKRRFGAHQWHTIVASIGFSSRPLQTSKMSEAAPRPSLQNCPRGIDGRNCAIRNSDGQETIKGAWRAETSGGAQIAVACSLPRPGVILLSFSGS